MEIATLLLVVAVVFVAATAHSVTGFGFALTVIPFFVIILDVQDAVVLSTILAFTTSLMLAPRIWSDVPWAGAITLVAGSLAGMPLGLLALLFAPEHALALAIGVATLVMAALLAAGARTGEPGSLGALIAGSLSGVLRTSTSLDGPPVVIYLQGAGYAPDAFRATLTVFFLAGGVLAIAVFAASGVVSGQALALAAGGVPFVYIGMRLGQAVRTRVEPLAFRRVVLALLVAGALSSVISAAGRLG